MAIIDIKIPTPGESITHVELYRWLVEDGAIVKKGTEIAELESEKATLTLVADETGKISHKATEGSMLEVGSVACIIDTSFQPDEEKSSEETVKNEPSLQEQTKVDISPQPEKIAYEEKILPQVSDNPSTFEKVKITPLAKKMMEENGWSIEDVINGLRRLKASDIEAAMNDNKIASSVRKVPMRDYKTERMSSLRRKLSERLVSVKNETAMLTTFNEVNMKAILDLRKKYQDQFVEKHGIKLGLMSFFMKASSIALLEYPNVNSSIEGENMIFYNYTDISVAVSTPKGLMVPVVRNVESLSLAEIEKQVASLSEKARKGKLSIPEMSGGTFTITNGGIFGSMMSTPIINPPQSSILGMHNILERPVAIEGQVAIRPMMYVALSYDHRVIDGKDSVGFLVRVKKLLENPVDMLFGDSSSERALLEL